MTIKEVIELVDELNPNQYSADMKLKWLNEVETSIFKNIVSTHENRENISFKGYTNANDETTQLIAPSPYDDLYTQYLISKIDYYNAEFNRYNNSSLQFNTIYQSFASYYNKNNMPITVCKTKSL